jgi:hypothetical protein
MMEDYRDAMPDNMQSSERHDRADEAVGAMEEALSNLEDALSSLENIE